MPTLCAAEEQGRAMAFSKQQDRPGISEVFQTSLEGPSHYSATLFCYARRHVRGRP